MFRQKVHGLLQLPLPAVEGQRVGKAPLDAYKLPGEFSATPLYEAFYAQAGFAESIGIVLSAMQPQTLAGSADVREFGEALLFLG